MDQLEQIGKPIYPRCRIISQGPKTELKPGTEARPCPPPHSALGDTRETRHPRVPIASQCGESTAESTGIELGAAAPCGTAPASLAHLGKLSKPTAAACPLDSGNWQGCWQETLLAEQCNKVLHVRLLEMLAQV